MPMPTSKKSDYKKKLEYSADTVCLEGSPYMEISLCQKSQEKKTRRWRGHQKKVQQKKKEEAGRQQW